MAQIVGHVRKIKTSVGLFNVVHHNQRGDIYNDDKLLINPQTNPLWYKPENAKFNQYEFLMNPYSKRDEIIKKAIKDNNGIWRKPQKNASAAIELVLSFSHDWGKGWETNPAQYAKVQKFMKKSRQFIERKYGRNVIHVAEHWDEKTPHFHAVLTPITKNIRIRKQVIKGKTVKEHFIEGAEWMYSSSNFLGGPKGMRELQNEIYENVKDLGLERGKIGSRATHQSLADFDQVVNDIHAQKSDLNELESDLNGFTQELNNRAKELSKREKGIEKAEKVVQTQQESNYKINEILDKKGGAPLRTIFKDLNSTQINRVWKKVKEFADEERATNLTPSPPPLKPPTKDKGRI